MLEKTVREPGVKCRTVKKKKKKYGDDEHREGDKAGLIKLLGTRKPKIDK